MKFRKVRHQIGEQKFTKKKIQTTIDNGCRNKSLSNAKCITYTHLCIVYRREGYQIVLY